MTSEARAKLEKRLLELLAAGDLRAAAEEAVRGFGVEILGYLGGLLRDPDAAEDVFALACERLWTSLPTFQRQCTVRVWFYKLAWNASMNFRKEAYRRRVRRLETTEISRIAADVVTRNSSLLRAEDRVAKLRQALEPDEQTILSLRLDRELSWREIALVLAEGAEAVEEAALRKRFERIKEKLRKMAVREGWVSQKP